jgi:hypothetical protein
MSIDPKILDQPRRLDLSALASATTAEVADAALAFLDAWRARTSLDHEILHRAGTAIAKAGHAGIDRAVLGWLDADPSGARLELAAWFLLGYWLAAGEVLPEAWIRLFEELDRLDPTSMTYMGVVSALAALVRTKAPFPAEDRARIRTALLRHLDDLEARKALPGLTSQLRWLRAG